MNAVVRWYRAPDSGHPHRGGFDVGQHPVGWVRSTYRGGQVRFVPMFAEELGRSATGRGHFETSDEAFRVLETYTRRVYGEAERVEVRP